MAVRITVQAGREDACAAACPLQGNILAAVRWLVGGCQAPDSLVFAFSGHGSLDASDASEGRDGILPCNFEEVLRPSHLCGPVIWHKIGK